MRHPAMLVESARGVSTEFVERKASGDGCLQPGCKDCGHSEEQIWNGLHGRPWRRRIGLSKFSACLLLTLYCQDDDLAEVVLAWSKLARGSRAQSK